MTPAKLKVTFSEPMNVGGCFARWLFCTEDGEAPGRSVGGWMDGLGGRGYGRGKTRGWQSIDEGANKDLGGAVDLDLASLSWKSPMSCFR